MQTLKKIPLNSAQQRAADFDGRHLLIVAGPGTGKTHTLIQRIAFFVPRCCAGEKILAITFTNKAAEQMQERLSALRQPEDCANGVAGGPSRVVCATFHGFCLDVLQSANFRECSWRLASEEEIERLSQSVWPKSTARQRREQLDAISRWKATAFDQPVPPEAAEYQRHLRRAGWLDFDDLLLETVRLLADNPAIQESLQQTYPYIFVDEYQDINRIQQTLLKALAGPRTFVTAIGDPNQAIYGFRGSDLAYFDQFERDFPGAVTMSLTENYRSTANLLAASSQVMGKGNTAYKPQLSPAMLAQGRLTIHAAATDKAEAEYVVHQIEKLVGGTSMFSQDSGRVGTEDHGEFSFGEVAVLYRLHSQGRLLAEAFDRSGIPYYLTQKTAAGVKGEAGAGDTADAICPPRYAEPAFDAEKVTLMTLHAAKGLEFDVVFIVGCEEKIIPLDMGDMGAMTAEPEEERRLFYVGMTRAKRRLYLVRSQRRRLYGRTWEPAPSRFLADIEEELKEYERAQRQPKRPRKEEEQMTLF